MRWTRRRTAAVVVLGVLVAAGAGLYHVGTLHVRRITGDPGATPNCLRCHGPAASGEVERPQGAVHADPSALAASPDGRLVYVACPPAGRIAVVDVEARSLARRVPHAGRPRGVGVSPDGRTLAVSLAGRDAVALLDAGSLERRAEVAVGVEPAGLSFDAAGDALFVANARSSDVSVVDVAAARETHRLAAGREPWAVVRSPDGRLVAVVSRMSEIGSPDRTPRSEVTLIDAVRRVVARRVPLDSCHLAEGADFTADSSRLLVPALRVRNLLPISQVARGWVMSSVLAVVRVASGDVAMLPLDSAGDCLPDPTSVRVAGDRAFVAAGGSDEVAVLDLAAALAHEPDAAPNAPERLSISRTYVTGRFAVGAHPRSLAVGTGGVLAVAERLDDAVSLHEAGGALLAQVAIGPKVPDDSIRRGDRVFHDARYAFQSSFSCRSCHPDCHTDGLTYDFDVDGVGRNIVLNRSLRGLKGTEPFKWNGLNPDIRTQCGPRFAKVLTRADPFPDDRLADLVEFLESLPPPPPDPRTGVAWGGDGRAAERGRAIFERTARRDGTPIPPESRCTTCHAPPHYTNHMKADVGTRTPRDDGGAFDVPHLTGIGSKAPYLHDGRARTLEEIWTAPGVGDSHGVMTDLNKADLNDLVEFLRGL